MFTTTHSLVKFLRFRATTETSNNNKNIRKYLIELIFLGIFHPCAISKSTQPIINKKKSQESCECPQQDQMDKPAKILCVPAPVHDVSGTAPTSSLGTAPHCSHIQNTRNWPVCATYIDVPPSKKTIQVPFPDFFGVANFRCRESPRSPKNVSGHLGGDEPSWEGG